MKTNDKIFTRVLRAQESHTTFLNATQKNLSYYFMGKELGIVKQTTIPMVDIVSILQTFSPKADNPLQNIVSAFTDEISASDFRTSVTPYPVASKEPYESYADILGAGLTNMHEQNNRRSYMKSISFELLAHGYFGIYCDGLRYYFLSAYNLIPGDKNIFDAQDQPMWIRKTQANRQTLEKAGVDMSKETPEKSYPDNFSDISPLETFTLYDTWIKDLDQNIMFTSSGQRVYTQAFPHPKRYPIFVGNTSELMNSFYTVPVISTLVEKLKDYQESRESIKSSTSSIAKPLLVYDSDAGINVDDVQRALKMGYKHIIIGKHREGDINFKAPGQLPAYAQQLPEQIEADIMKALGLNKAFLGTSNEGARESGALARLIKTSFRKLATVSQTIENTFTELDSYVLDYYKTHSIMMQDKLGMNIEEFFTGNVIYKPQERFKAYSTEDSFQNKMFTMNAWKNKLIPTETALNQLGDDAPKKTMEKMKVEVKDKADFAIKEQQDAQSFIHKTTLDKVSEALRGQLKFRFYLSPISEDRVLVNTHVSDSKHAAFILSPYTNNVLMDEYIADTPAPPEQVDPTVKPEPIGLPPIQPGIPGQPGLPAPTPQDGTKPPQTPPQGPPAPEDGRGRPSDQIKEPTKQIQDDAGNTKKVVGQVDKNNKDPNINNAAPEIVDTSAGFNESELETMIAKSATIYNQEKYYDLPGMYIVEPHAKWIYTGKKVLLVLGKSYPEMIGKPLLFTGKQAYGVIVLKKIINDFDFDELRKYHLVTQAEKKRWWKDKPVYLYMFEFYPFRFPVEYNKQPGQLIFFGQADVVNDTAVKVEDPNIKTVEPINNY